jgi:hypothetical protein
MRKTNKPQKLKNTNSRKKLRENWKKNIIRNRQLISEEMLKELESRYNYALEHPEDGLSWEEVKSALLSK